MPGGDRTLGLWIHRAMDDYAGARCCLLNGLFSGFLLAQQSVEKLLKALLRCQHPGESDWVGSRAKHRRVDQMVAKAGQHDLVALATLVEQSYPHLRLMSQHGQLLKRLTLHFVNKYPDSSAEGLTGYSTSEIDEVDALVVQLALALPLPKDLRWRVGLHSTAWRVAGIERGPFPWDDWVFSRNKAVEPFIEDLCREVRAGIGRKQGGLEGSPTRRP
jgi:hypothetical protein